MWKFTLKFCHVKQALLVRSHILVTCRRHRIVFGASKHVQKCLRTLYNFLFQMLLARWVCAQHRGSIRAHLHTCSWFDSPKITDNSPGKDLHFDDADVNQQQCTAQSVESALNLVIVDQAQKYQLEASCNSTSNTSVFECKCSIKWSLTKVK